MHTEPAPKCSLNLQYKHVCLSEDRADVCNLAASTRNLQILDAFQGHTVINSYNPKSKLKLKDPAEADSLKVPGQNVWIIV